MKEEEKAKEKNEKYTGIWISSKRLKKGKMKTQIMCRRAGMEKKRLIN